MRGVLLRWDGLSILAGAVRRWNSLTSASLAWDESLAAVARLLCLLFFGCRVLYSILAGLLLPPSSLTYLSFFCAVLLFYYYVW